MARITAAVARGAASDRRSKAACAQDPTREDELKLLVASFVATVLSLFTAALIALFALAGALLVVGMLHREDWRI